MAIAEPALRQFVSNRFKVKGPGLAGIVIGTGIGIGMYIYENWETFSPFGGSILNPPGSGKPGGIYLDVPSQANASANKFRQTLRQYGKQYSSRRKQKKRRACGCCCTGCNH